MKLFENEDINFKNMKLTRELKVDENEINEKYNKGDVRIVTEQARYPLNTITSMIESGDYLLNPEFQRRHRWDNKTRSKLIESFIMNVPVPPIFLYEVEFSYYEVMDGLQRLTTIHRFYKDGFRLQGLDEWVELNGYLYSELPEKIRKGIDRRYLSSIILLQETAKNKEDAQLMKQLVFERINSGGVKLESQEIRNALYDCKLNKLCMKLARDKHFCMMWEIPIPPLDEIEKGEISEELLENSLYKKMMDVELVLRYFAFRQIDKYERQTLQRFLDYYLENARNFSDDILNRFENLFIKTTELLYKVFAEKAFNLYRLNDGKWVWYDRPTRVIYDPIMFVFSKYLDNSEALIKNKANICRDIELFYKENYKEFAGRDSNSEDIRKRISYLDNFIKKYVVVE